MRVFFIRALVLACVLSAPVVYAQDLSSPKEMFEKDYVQPKEESHSAPVVPKPDKKDKSQGKAPEGQAAQTPNTAEERLQQVFQELRIEDPRSDQEKGVPKIYQKQPLGSMGAILNASDANHFKSELGKLVGYIRQTKLKVGTIYALGVPQEVDTKLAFFVNIRGGKISFVDKLPERYAALALSPTWLLQTEKEEIMIEGVEDFRMYVSEKGEYTGPK